MARPRGGDWLEAEISSLSSQEVTVVVSLLTAHETLELGLSEEADLCARARIEFLQLPILDRGCPDDIRAANELIAKVLQAVTSGSTVVVHCRMGIGRSAMIAAAVLTLMGMPSETAFDEIGRARGCEVPDTSEQRSWVSRFQVRRAFVELLSLD